MSAASARRKLTEKVARMSDSLLLDSIKAISLKGESLEVVVVRVSLLNEYETRYGGSAVDALMDELGL